MINYNDFFSIIKTTALKDFADETKAKYEASLFRDNFEAYLSQKALFQTLPNFSNSLVDLTSDAIKIQNTKPLSSEQQQNLEKVLEKLMPWRKGPFEIFGIDLDTEWRSNLKWDRVKKHMDFKNKVVLDIGAGSGYYAFRMKGGGAKLVLGLEPYFLYFTQFCLLNKFVQAKNVAILPFAFEDFPNVSKAFDTIFLMGVLYHLKSPIEHLVKIKACLKDAGELVLETLVLDSKKEAVLTPKEVYGKMSNVWFIPSLKTMEIWLERAGFKNIRCIDLSKTGNDEQRKTKWMNFESLSDFLDPTNPNKTVEGYPAHTRAIFLANS